jgi:hypothetical protein
VFEQPISATTASHEMAGERRSVVTGMHRWVAIYAYAGKGRDVYGWYVRTFS